MHGGPRRIPGGFALEQEAFSIEHTQGFTFPLYNHITLTVDLPEMKGAKMLEKFKPDLIHVTSP